MSDDDAKKRYEDVKNERFGAPEKRAVEQIIYASEAEAAAARAKLSSGKTFDDLLKDKNLTAKDASLGTVTKGALVDKDVADAAFSLKKEGEVSAPVKAQFGTVIVRVGKIVPSTVKPYPKSPRSSNGTSLCSVRKRISTAFTMRSRISAPAGKSLAEAAQERRARARDHPRD